MAQAMASMAGLRGSSQGVLDGSLQLGGSSRLSGAASARAAPARQALPAIRASAESDAGAAPSGRRAMLALVAAGLGGTFAKAALAEAKPIKVGPPPPPSGGLPGTLNADQPRDLDLPLKSRFFIQPLSPAEAAQRAKESAKDILGVKTLIEKKAWPYVQMDLRLKAEYLRYDLNTIISAKPKEEKKALKELTGALFSKIDNLDHAAKIKSTPEAEKYYAETKSVLDNVLSKLG